MSLCSISKERHNARSIHVLTPRSTHSQFKIGRSHDANIRLNDISVSRIHAMISYTQDGFVLEDNDSKFGTLVLLHGKQELSLGQQLSLQVNKAVLTFAIKSNHLLPSRAPAFPSLEPRRMSSSEGLTYVPI